MTGINRRNCLKVLAGGVLGLPAALVGETAEAETLAMDRPCAIFEPRDGHELLGALSEARDGDWIILRSRTYDCRLHSLWVPPGVRINGAIGHGAVMVRCRGIAGGDGSVVSRISLTLSRDSKES